MAFISDKKSIYFNDVVILPSITKVNSRSEIEIDLSRIYCSPMPSVVGYTFAKKALELGLSVCLHRFCSAGDSHALYKDLKQVCNIDNLFGTVGLDDWERVKRLANEGCKNFLLDIANGTIPQITKFCHELPLYGEINSLMLGNIVTGEQLKWLVEQLSFCASKKYIIRVGIGNGTSCQTSDETAINRGQITELMECRETLSEIIFNKFINIGNYPNIWLASDGGINKTGSICKAFGAGADAVLIGGMFSATLEAETNITGDGSYYGCASEKAQKLLKGEVYRHSEGKDLQLNKELKPLEEIIKQIKGSIASCLSYTGNMNIPQFIGNGVFEKKYNSLPPRIRY